MEKSSSDTLKFRSDADIADFVCVLVDNNVISPTYYTKSEGSTIIELKSSYLDTLSAGKHTLTIRSTTGDAVATFSIEEKPTTTTQATTQTTTTATTQATTQATTEATTDFMPYTTERTTTEYTMHEYTTRAKRTTETTTEVTTERSSKQINNYKSSDTVDKRKSRVRNLQLVILITVLATILASFIIILISGRKK